MKTVRKGRHGGSGLYDFDAEFAGSAGRAAQENAYRAVTPVLISLVVMIATVLMLFYFTMLYCVNPIVAMNKGLGQYLTFRIPFAVKAECKDEILELKEKSRHSSPC